MAQESWDHMGERVYLPGIDHGSLYIRPAYETIRNIDDNGVDLDAIEECED